MFAPKKSKKIAAKIGKTAFWCRSHDGDAADSGKPIRPIVSRPCVPKIFPAKFFWFEKWYGRIFFAAKFFGPDFFRLEIRNVGNFSG